MLSLIPLPYKLAAVAIAALALFGFGYFKGYSNANGKYQEFQAQVAAEQEAIHQENERKVLALNALVDRYERDLRGAHVALAARPIRVQSNCSTGGVQALPSAALKPDGAAQTLTLDPQQCETYLNAGVEDAATLLWLQAWIRDAHEATK